MSGFYILKSLINMIREKKQTNKQPNNCITYFHTLVIVCIFFVFFYLEFLA